MSRTAFIICSYITNDLQKELFKRCIKSIRIYHPSDDIIVLDDTSPELPFPLIV